MIGLNGKTVINSFISILPKYLIPCSLFHALHIQILHLSRILGAGGGGGAQDKLDLLSYKAEDNSVLIATGFLNVLQIIKYTYKHKNKHIKQEFH